MATFLQDLPPSTAGIAFFISMYILYRIVKHAVRLHRCNMIIRKNGCKRIPSYPHRDPIFGLYLFFENSKLSRTGGFLERFEERYLSLNAWTFSQLLLGVEMINTAEPQNIKALLATQFREFELAGRRKAAFQPVFGPGIFTTDCKDWEISRALLRPNLTRSQVGDLDTFDHHISKLISRIPTDGSTVDLQALFCMLTLDSATEFLFGESAGVLDGGLTSERGNMFSEAFTYATEKIGLQGRLGKLAVIMPDKKFKDSVEVIHQYVRNHVQKAVDLHKTTPAGEKEEHRDSSRYVFLEELAETGYSEKKIRDELLNILLPGRNDSLLAELPVLYFGMQTRRL